MIRLSRAGREAAIRQAILQLVSKGKYKMFTRGEICRKMGIRSTSKIRDMLNDMVDNHMLVGATTALDGYQAEVAIYGLYATEQLPLVEANIIINGLVYDKTTGKLIVGEIPF